MSIYIVRRQEINQRKTNMITGKRIVLAAMVTMTIYGGLQVVSMVLDLTAKIGAMAL